MVPWEIENVPDRSARTFSEDHSGCICSGHTSHSHHAGRMRRVTRDISVKISNGLTVKELNAILNLELKSDVSGWTLFVLGYHSKISENDVKRIYRLHRLFTSVHRSAVSIYLSVVDKLCIINISPGTLIKKLLSGGYFDNVEVHKSDVLDGWAKPHIQTEGNESVQDCFSTFFGLVPHVTYDRQPRPTISSGQIIQAIYMPWCPATALVSPVNSFQPLVQTPVLNEIVTEGERIGDSASIIPGMDVCVLYHNMEDNYEDSLIVSSKFADLGAFSSVSVCKYSLPYGSSIPNVVESICSIICPWWKGPCSPLCTHKLSFTRTHRKTTIIGRNWRGVCISRHQTTTGEWSVSIRSHQLLQTGDKITTCHGQKGVGVIKPVEDLPIVETSEGDSVTPDIVVAMSSIVSRQTNGQHYESQSGIKALRNCGIVIVESHSVSKEFDEVEIINGRTGEYFDYNGRR